MKVAVTARGPGAEFGIDEGFGRAYWFLILDDTTGEWEMIDNSEIRNALDNAGVRSAKVLADCGVDVLLTGETGPKAFRTLQAEGIDVFHGASGTVEEALQSWYQGKLVQAFCAKSKGSPSCLVAPAEMDHKRFHFEGFRSLVSGSRNL